MKSTYQLVVFLLDDRRYALRLAAVERIVSIVEIEPLPKAPAIVLGVVNVQGRIVPVVDLRRRFGLPPREIQLTDHLIVARTRDRTVGLVADTVVDIMLLLEKDLATAAAILPGLDYLEGVAKLESGLVFVHDLDTFLSLGETNALAAALAPAEGRA